MQRALGVTQPQEATSVKPQISTKPEKVDMISNPKQATKDLLLKSPQRKPPAESASAESGNKTEITNIKKSPEHARKIQLMENSIQKESVNKLSQPVSGMMFSHGSSILSSASNLITSAVQEQPNNVQQEEGKPVQDVLHPNGTFAKSHPKAPSVPSACPLCKVDLKTSCNDQPNYNTCTECKNIVCNQCGFNPMTSESQVRKLFF